MGAKAMETLEKAAGQFALTMGYAALGLLAFGLAFLVVVKVTPFSLRKEIEEDHNSALAIVLGAVILGVAIIVAATVHG
jgi:putative membrane protein